MAPGACSLAVARQPCSLCIAAVPLPPAEPLTHVLPAAAPADVRLLLAGKEPQPAECIAHPGRKVCKVDV